MNLLTFLCSIENLTRDDSLFTKESFIIGDSLIYKGLSDNFSTLQCCKSKIHSLNTVLKIFILSCASDKLLDPLSWPWEGEGQLPVNMRVNTSTNYSVASSKEKEIANPVTVAFLHLPIHFSSVFQTFLRPSSMLSAIYVNNDTQIIILFFTISRVSSKFQGLSKTVINQTLWLVIWPNW